MGFLGLVGPAAEPLLTSLHIVDEGPFFVLFRLLPLLSLVVLVPLGLLRLRAGVEPLRLGPLDLLVGLLGPARLEPRGELLVSLDVELVVEPVRLGPLELLVGLQGPVRREPLGELLVSLDFELVVEVVVGLVGTLGP